MYTLTTLATLRAHIGLEDTDTSENPRLLTALQAASAAIERHTGRTLQPYQTTIAHTVDLFDAQTLLLTDDLLMLQSITNGDGMSIALSDVLQVEDSVLRLTNGAYFAYNETPQDAISVTGIWGYHPRGYAGWDSAAWADSGDTVQDTPLSASATTLTVSDADAGTPARFQVGQLLRLADEYLRVIAVDSTSNQLTVQRGVQGTAASSHLASTPIEIYQTPPEIVQLTLRWALWFYREPDSFTTQLPPVLLQTLVGLRRVSVRN